MLKFKDIVRYICATVIYLYKYIKDLLKMDSVYDCARPFMLVAGIFGMGGSTISATEFGVRSVRNTRLSLLIAALIALVITPGYFIDNVPRLFADRQRTLVQSTYLIIQFGRYAFVVSTAAVTCIRTHIYCKNLTKVFQILNNTDMMLKQENIHVNYWKITLKTILFGLISCDYLSLDTSIQIVLEHISPRVTGLSIARVIINTLCESYFMWLILFLLIIRERFVGVNKLILQNAQVPSIIQDDLLLRRISLARDIHEQLSEVIELFSDLSRFIIIGVLVSGILISLLNAVTAAMHWNQVLSPAEIDNVRLLKLLLEYSYAVILPIIKIIILTAVCEGHKNNRQVLNARLRYLISREEDPRTVHQLKQYIWYIHDTVPGLVDFQLVDVDFTLLFTVIDIIAQYLFVIYSYVRPSYTVNPN